MIIVRIGGGMCNQFYNYAFGQAYSKKNNCDVLYDITAFKNAKLQNITNSSRQHYFYCLKLYKTKVRLATPDQCIKVQNMVTYNDRFPHFLNKLLRRSGNTISHYIRNKNLKNAKYLFSLKGDMYIQGHWRSEEYFADYRDELIDDFTLDIPLDERNTEMMGQIKSTNSVSMHIRRGDYVRENIVLPLSYYKRSIDYIFSQIKNPHFYIFSNDPNWVRENINIEAPFTVVDINNENKGYYDLELIRNCKHNIIANSTFSWWGAWLNRNNEKIVIAPKVDGSDFYPKSWVQINRK